MKPFAEVVQHFDLHSVDIERWDNSGVDTVKIWLHFEHKLVVEHRKRGVVKERNWLIKTEEASPGAPQTVVHIGGKRDVNTRTTDTPLLYEDMHEHAPRQRANALVRLIARAEYLLVEEEVDPYA